MRIAMYTDSFYPYVSGVTTAVITLANGLAKNGHHIFIQAAEPKEKVDLSFLHPNVTVKYVRAMDILIYPDLRLGTNLPLFLNDIKKFNPDVIHVHTPLSIGLEGILIGKRLKLPIVQTFHTYFMDPDALKLIGIRNEKLAGLITRGGWRLNRVLTSLCNVTIAPTNYVAKDLREHGTREPIVVCPNILPSSTFAVQTHQNQQLSRLLFVGRLSPEKRVDLLLRAVAQVQDRPPRGKVTVGPSYSQFTPRRTVLHIIGDGPERQNLFDLSLELGIGPQIRWWGQVPHQQLIDEHLYHQGDVFVTLSRSETYGYTTLEAMAHQLPAIALASPANKEVIDKSGFLVPDTPDPDKAVRAVANKINSVSKMPLDELRQKAYQQAEKYHANQLLPLYEKTYQKAIEGKADG